MKNKKGQVEIIWAVALGIFFLLFFLGGGLSASWNIAKIITSITEVLKSIPTIVWVVLIIIFLLRIVGGKRRR